MFVVYRAPRRTSQFDGILLVLVISVSRSVNVSVIMVFFLTDHVTVQDIRHPFLRVRAEYQRSPE